MLILIIPFQMIRNSKNNTIFITAYIIYDSAILYGHNTQNCFLVKSSGLII